MRISNLIEDFIKQSLKQSGETELQRNVLAVQLGCVPSQINYVLATRFSPERGYVVESRRGGGGYIKVTQVRPGDGNYVMHCLNVIGESISQSDAKAFVVNFLDYGIITQKEAKLIISAISSLPLPQPEQNTVRAVLLKNILLNL